MNPLGLPDVALVAVGAVELALASWQLYRHRPPLDDWWRRAGT